ncbi:MAG: TIGR00282 family metallophosphoesterase [Pseudomonadota bacterium]
MRILFLGDVVGRPGREAVARDLPGLRAAQALDFVVVNGENATSGMGLSAAHAKLLLDAGADVVTLGDHAFDQKEMMTTIESEPRLLRPVNFAKVAPGRGVRVYDAPGGKRVAVLVLLGQVFMRRPFDDPWSVAEAELAKLPLGTAADAIVVDFHAEATSEKMAMGHWCDGRASLVVGTHTHVPTSDVQVLRRGTAYMTDAGMCGDYDSVIGMDKTEPMRRFVTGMGKTRFAPSAGPATLSGVIVETGADGKAVSAEPLRVGGRLAQAMPA